MNFLEQYEQMGLTRIGDHTFAYSDKYSGVKYELLKTCDSNISVPLLSIWTNNLEKNDNGDLKTPYKLQGITSLLYYFVGNDVINSRIREAITDLGKPIFREHTLINGPKYTTMHNSILIQNQNNIPQVGDVYPHVSIRNSYNGTTGIEISFGITILRDNIIMNTLSFRNTLIKYRQIHSQNARTKLSTAIGEYVQSFSDNILELIKVNFETKVSEEALLATLDLVEEVGQRRRNHISDALKKITEGKDYISCWDLFMAITMFSTLEKNLNAKTLLENIVERTLVIPVKMMEMANGK